MNGMRDLNGMIILLGLANHMKVKPIESWPEDTGFDLQQLDQQSSKLTLGDAEILVDGEDNDRNEVVKKYNIKELDLFLEAAFDGHLNEVFYT